MPHAPPAATDLTPMAAITSRSNKAMPCKVSRQDTDTTSVNIFTLVQNNTVMGQPRQTESSARLRMTHTVALCYRWRCAIALCCDIAARIPWNPRYAPSQPHPAIPSGHPAMRSGVLLELELVLLVVCSLVAPAGAYAFLYGRWSISRRTVLGFAMLLIVLAGVDVALLQSLTEKARRTPDLPGMQLFTDQLALVLYVLPAALAGLGVNLLSHVLISHLGQAERRFDHQHSHATSTPHLQHWQTGLVMLAIGAIFLLDLYSGNDIRLHALYLFPLAWVARHRQGWLPTTLTLLTVSASQIVTFSLAAAGMASFITDALVSLSASCLVVVLARQSGQRQQERPFAPRQARDIR